MTRVHRLTSSRDFRRVTTMGRRASSLLVAVAVAPGIDGVTRIGVSASTKLGGAVARNRAKRLLRAASREIQLEPGRDIVLSARPALLRSSFGQIGDELARALRIAGATC